MEMSTLKKVDAIMYYVQDLDRAVRFYEQVLGLTLACKDQQRKMIGFKLAESQTEIVIHRNASLPNPTFSFLVDDVKDFCVYLEKMNYEVNMQPIEVWCGYFVVFEDLDGNEIPIIDLTRFGGVPQYDGSL